MSEQNKALVRRLFDRWNDKDHARVNELFAPNVVTHTPDGDFIGLKGSAALLAAYAGAFPDFHLTIDDLVAEGDKVAVRWTFAGTHRGPLGDVPATGKSVRVSNGVGIYRLAEGKISEGHLAYNKFELLQKLGVLPATAQASASV